MSRHHRGDECGLAGILRMAGCLDKKESAARRDFGRRVMAPDCGVQYSATDYVNVLKQRNVSVSMAAVGLAKTEKTIPRFHREAR